ncbi:proline/glycine betaine ABC transporter permease [Salinisphaera sp. LB1]|uniref:ABC transporter permease n=1 Tax=Salinisphaera sp. LB1 TaxID=2183911 RepID=UPI000D707FA7|nr:proline/glycine betaine ABC transporter permease [Salinisphaera sp. LB1]AWN16374.1 L-proline glycine betaine ABC transport system permease protein ProW [Salinisphaera sp. LB1]
MNDLVINLPIGDWFTAVVTFMQTHFDLFFSVVSAVISFVADNLTAFLNYLPAPVVFAVLAFLALWRVGWQFTIFVLVALYVVMGMDLWPETMDTLGLVLAATLAALGVGLPLGVVMAKSDVVLAIIRPILDFMQTLPAFVYLIPAVIFFGTGRVPGVIATVIFSMPPAVRLMNIGIRYVPTENVEAGKAFGCNGLQLLWRVELPLALPSIMAGINQTIMLALSMVVIASMIGAGGLGDPVLAGIQQLRLGTGFQGGLGVVILAIILDRLTQSFGERQRDGGLLSRLKKLFSGSSAGASST